MVLRKKLDLHEAVLNVLNYFEVFEYAPTTLQIHRYIGVKTSRKDLEIVLNEMVVEEHLHVNQIEYTRERIWLLPSVKGHIQKRSEKYVETVKKLKRAALFFRCMSHMPYVDFVGITGSCAMHNADTKDDIDVFIISAPGGIWVVRFLGIALAKVLSIHRKRGMKNPTNKVCLNLFFDGGHLAVPDHKRNLYTAHEVAQIVPVIVRGGVYRKFLKANKWVSLYFPNISIPRDGHMEQKKPSLLMRFLNACAKKIQVSRINNSRTTEIVSDQQLWFFPDDFQMKIEKRVDIFPRKI
jgi:hypothetical protein